MWMIGNLVDVGLVDGGEFVMAQGTSSLFVYNNVIRRTHSGTLFNDNIGIRVYSGAKLEAHNNVIYQMANSYGSANGGSRGVGLDGSAGSAITSNLFLSTGRWFVYGPLSMNTALYNNSTVTFSGGIVPQNTLVADPLVVDTTDFVLGAASPARNAGNPDPRFNDIDGTRNDMGIYGGPFYDPEGRTGSKPVVLKAELDNTQFVRGELSTVKLKATGAATGAP
jgi:hypothetical protein